MCIHIHVYTSVYNMYVAQRPRGSSRCREPCQTWVGAKSNAGGEEYLAYALGPVFLLSLYIEVPQTSHFPQPLVSKTPMYELPEHGRLAAWLPGCLAAWRPGCLAIFETNQTTHQSEAGVRPIHKLRIWNSRALIQSASINTCEYQHTTKEAEMYIGK